MASPTPSEAIAPPAFLHLAGHRVRWRLLSALTRGDMRVGDLCRRLGLPQSLVSYHLRQLRSAALISARRSSHDARDVYYMLNLTRCGELLADTGLALHPGLRLTPPGSPRTMTTVHRSPARVLFLCTGNSARSQIAQALVEHAAGGSVHAVSAGSRPKPLHPNAVRVLRQRGIDIAGRSSKHLATFADQRFDYVISLCDRVREVCPQFPGHPDHIHWSIPDPAREGATDEETHPAFERTLTELETRTAFLLELIAHEHPAPRRGPDARR